LDRQDARHWTQHQPTLLKLLARERFGLISDFDGTLSPFAALPQDAAIDPNIAPLLDQLVERCAVVALLSGRGVRDLRDRFAHPHIVYYGNHGMELWRDDQVQVVAAARGWVTPLAHLLAEVTPKIAFDGVLIENKGVTASVHYRMTATPREARHVLRARLSPLCEKYGFRLSEGQYIWEIKPPIKVDKGTALRAIVEDYALESVLFAGDDVTDYAAMDALRQIADEAPARVQGVSVGVVHPTTPPELFRRCDFTVNGVNEVQQLLAWLLVRRRNE
jgi:trehalose 6-phosphate phosphatase